MQKFILLTRGEQLNSSNHLQTYLTAAYRICINGMLHTLYIQGVQRTWPFLFRIWCFVNSIIRVVQLNKFQRMVLVLGFLKWGLLFYTVTYWQRNKYICLALHISENSNLSNFTSCPFIFLYAGKAHILICIWKHST